MRRHAGLIMILIMVMAGTTACGRAEQPPAGEVETTVGEQIEIRVGQTIQISRRGFPIAGFTWDIETAPSEILEPVGALVVELDSDDIDSEATFIFTFRGVSAGTTTIKLIYHKPFEQELPAATYEASITVIP